VPVSAFANLLGVLGQRAFAQAESVQPAREGFPEYLYRDRELTVDPVSPEQRAERLMELLNEGAAVRRRLAARLTEADEFYSEYDEFEELDLAELAEPELEPDSEF
jgi:hypothetical protein